MSFPKVLECERCKRQFTIEEENFPEDLYHLIFLHKISQLFWLCKSCQRMKEDSSYQLISLSAEVKETRSDLSDLTERVNYLADTVQNIQISMRDLDNSKVYDSNNLDDSGFQSCSDTTNYVSFSHSVCDSSSNLRSINKRAHKILEDKLKDVNLDEAKSKACNTFVSKFLNVLIEKLKNDPEFNLLYLQPLYTGSSYSDLRISSAADYDIDIMLKMPKEIKLEVEVFENMFAKLKWEQPINLPESKKTIPKFLERVSEKQYLIPSKINSWFQSIVDKNLSMGISDEISEVTFNQNGPARTAKIKTNSGIDVSLDLVPVFCFNYSIFSHSSVSEIFHKFPVKAEKEIALLVPKPLKASNKFCQLSQLNSVWRIDLPELERAILSKRSCSKPVIRLMKLLRDNMDWKGIASYYIKNTILLEIISHPDEEYWKPICLSERFLDGLRKLKNCLKRQEIPHYIFSNYNLIYQLNPDQCANWHNKLDHIIASIEDDCNEIHNILKVSQDKSVDCMLGDLIIL